MKPSVIITGATGYFGRHLVDHLKAKYLIIAVSRSSEKLNELFGKDDSIKTLALDLYEPEVLKKKLYQSAMENNVIGLINNAYDFSSKTGFNTPDGTLEKISVERLKAGLESGLLAQIVAAQAVGTAMIEKKIAGSIINVSSMYAHIAPNPQLYAGKENLLNPMIYSITKAGLEGLTRYIASFWGSHGIRCNSVAPGSFPKVESKSGPSLDHEFLDRLKARTLLGRVGHPRDLFGVMEFLLSDSSSYVTGQSIGVDGGWTVT